MAAKKPTAAAIYWLACVWSEGGPALEIAVTGNRPGLIQLAEAVASGHGPIQCGTAPASLDMYEHAISEILVVPESDSLVRFEVDREDGRLCILGGPWAMALLARNLYGMATDGRVGSHWHAEFFPGHLFIDARSPSTVVKLIEGPDQGSTGEGRESP